MSVGAIDLAILAVYMAGGGLFGLWIGRATTTARDYMVGGRRLPWWLILFSIVATETSTVTFLSIPGFAFERDMTWLQIPLGFLIGRYAVAWLLMPHYFRGELFTAYEVLAGRKPFEGDSPREILARQLDRSDFVTPRELNPEIPPVLEKSILKCLERDPDKRHPIISVLVLELKSALYV